MLPDEDIKRLMGAFQEMFPMKEEFETFRDEMKGDFSNLLTSVDAYAKRADTFFQEMVMISH